MLRHFIVDQEHAGIRLDVFLASQYDEFSRERIKKFILEGAVIVDGVPMVEPKYKLRAGQNIEADFEEESNELKPSALIFTKVYEDDSFLVIDKPAGLVVHPGAGVREDTVANMLVAQYPAIKNVGHSMRPGIVHRLDKDTSGLMLIAKDEVALEYAKAFFKSRTVTKEYMALVGGKLEKQHGFIEKPLLLDPARKRVKVAEEGKPSKTEFKVAEYYTTGNAVIESLGSAPQAGLGDTVSPRIDGSALEDSLAIRGYVELLPHNQPIPQSAIDIYTLVRVILHTGRMHQIRVHFTSIGHPLAGDALYGRSVPVPPGLTRQFLHASRLMFKLPNGTVLDLESALPQDLQETLASLQRL